MPLSTSVLYHINRILQIGHPTVLVNNAGVVQGKLILDLSPEDIRQSVSLLLIAKYTIIQPTCQNL